MILLTLIFSHSPHSYFSVLHDGAPNVGTAWIQDAYTQNELVLQSLKLACEFLVPSGVFVTKVFRSKDYNSLLWVFNQLFHKVEATKPPSSRNVSAEIFVVCQGFKAPKRIDPKFLDPKYVFKDLDVSAGISLIDSKAVGKAADPAIAAAAAEAGTTAKSLTAVAKLAHNAQANVFEPEKRKRKRDGYDEGDYTLFKSVPVSQFVQASDAVGMLGTFNTITFPPSLKSAADEVEKVILQHPATTKDIKADCQDLRVLGKREFRNLLKWRLAVREELGLEVSSKTAAAAKAEAEAEKPADGGEVVEIEEEQQIDEELQRMQEELQRRQRKLRRNKNEKKQKEVLKMQLKMGTPMDIGMELEDDALRGEHEFFDLGEAETKKGKGAKRSKKAAEKSDDDDSDDDESDTISVPGDTSPGDSNNDVYVDAEEGDEDADEEAARLAQLEDELDTMYDRYKEDLQARDAKFKASEARRKADKKGVDDQEWYGIKDEKEGSDAENSDEEESDEGGYDVVMSRKDAEETFDTDDEEDEEDEREAKAAARRAALKKARAAEKARGLSSIEQDNILPDNDESAQRLIKQAESSKSKKERLSREASIWFDNPLFKDLDGLDAAEEEEESEEEEASEEEEEDTEDSASEAESDTPESEAEQAESEDDYEIVPQGAEAGFEDETGEWAYEDDDEDAAKRMKVAQLGLNTAEAVTMAQALVNRQQNKASMLDAGFNKHNFVDKSGNLPTWFLDDEAKFYKSNIPITKEAVEALRARQRALDARPIKKIAEAKARKKMKAAQRLDKARKKAEGILEDADDLNEKEKAGSIEKVLAKGTKAVKKREVKLVVAKGTNRALKGRPKGVKGRYKMVDRRGKKELRAQSEFCLFSAPQ